MIKLVSRRKKVLKNHHCYLLAFSISVSGS